MIIAHGLFRLTLLLGSAASAAVAAPAPNGPPAECIRFAIADDERGIRLAGEVWGAAYPANTLWEVYTAAGGARREEFDKDPAQVCLWDAVYLFQRDVNARAKLYLGAESLDVAGATQRAQPVSPSLEACLRGQSLEWIFYVGDYTIVLVRKQSATAGESYLNPVPLRVVNGAYRITSVEYPLNAPTSLLCSLAPALDPRQRSRNVSPAQLSGLERVRISAVAPSGATGSAAFSGTWLPREDAAADSAAVGQVALYVHPVCVSSASAGRKLLAGDGTVGSDPTDSAAHELAHLLTQSWSASTLADQERVWHSYYHREIADRAAKAAARGLREAQAVSHFRSAPSAVFVGEDTVFLASIDCGAGRTICYWVNPQRSAGSLETVGDVALVRDGGKTVLAHSFLVQERGEGLVYEMLASDAVKSGVVNLLAAQAPDALAAVKAALAAPAGGVPADNR